MGTSNGIVGGAENLANRRYYQPTEQGFEKEVAERLQTLERLKKEQES